MNTTTNQENNTNKTTANINTITTNQENNINNTVITYVKTPKWIKDVTCTINPENNKKLGNKLPKYAIAASKTSGNNRSRLKSIEEFMNEFNFKDINYPPVKKDYKTFENNNPSIKLTTLKTTENERELTIHHNEIKNNDRKNKIA